MIQFVQRIFTLSVVLFFAVTSSSGQNLFSNGDLEGTAPAFTVPQPMPAGWTSVPNTDPTCDANSSISCTPDIVAASGGFLINVIPQSGTYSMSGLDGFHSVANGGSIYHEGLQQTVSGLTIGLNYRITFYQTVEGQFNALDQSGGWEVYMDNTKIGSTAPSTTTLTYTVTNRPWDVRTLTFQATAGSHTFKFFPEDDDTDGLLSEFSPNGALRMGIDNITLERTTTLDVTYAYFEGKLNQDRVNLDWVTSTETNSDHFVVQKSINGTSWSDIAEVAAVGNSNFQRMYDAVDRTPYRGVNYYRIVQVNLDGEKIYSKVITVDASIDYNVTIYPNPATDFIHVELDSEVDAELVKFSLFNLMGQEVPVSVKQEGRTYQVDVQELGADVYILEVNSLSNVKRYKIQKQ